MHRVDRAAGCVRRDCGKKGGIKNSEADFLALHISVRSGDAEMLMDWVALRFGPPTQEHAAEKQDHHCRPHSPAVPLIFDHATEVVRKSAPDCEDCQHLRKI